MDQLLRETFRRANHSQRLMRTKAGNWLWFRENGPAAHGQITLYSATRDAETFGDFSGCVLAGENGVLARSGAQGSAAWFSADTLAYGFVSENAIVFACGKLSGGGWEWTAVESIPVPTGTERLLGTLRVTNEGDLAFPWSVQRGAESVTGVTVGKPGAWHCHPLAEGRGAFAPFLLDDRPGVFHLAWAQADEQVYYWRGLWGDLGKTKPAPAALVALDGRQPLVMKTGADIHVIFESHYSYPQEVIIRSGQCPEPERRVFSSILKKDPRFAYAVCHSLQLTWDAHGVPTLFFTESYRRQLFYTRWLGEDWGPVLSLPGLRARSARSDHSYLAIASLAAEEQSREEGAALGLFAEGEGGLASPHFLRYQPVDLAQSAGSPIQFLDLREFSAISGFEPRGLRGEKAPENPLITSGGPHSFNQNMAVNGGSFLRTAKGWEAWFRGIGVAEHEMGFEWWKSLITGYAESADGLRWNFPSLGLSEGGAGFHNVIPGLPGQYTVFYDPDDADPQRRYKIVYFLIAGEKEIQAQAGEYDYLDNQIPGWFFHSPDGRTWSRQPIALRCPGSMGFEHCPMSLFRDPADPDPQRLWKSYGYASLTLGRRSCSLATSPDLIHWTLQKDPALPAERHGYPLVPAGTESQVHGIVVERVGACYLALVQYQYHAARSWIELAVSRDGLHFDPIHVGQPLVECGEAGAWDDGMMIPLNFWPESDHWKIYYNGFTQPQAGRRPEASVGVARFVPNGLAVLEMCGNQRKGTVQTIPVRFQQGQRYMLSVRASGGDLKAGILNEGGDELLSSDVVRADGQSQAITWQNEPFFVGTGQLSRITLVLQRTDPDPPRLFSMEFRRWDGI